VNFAFPPAVAKRYQRYVTPEIIATITTLVINKQIAIVGLPGERFSIDHGIVKINGQPLAEPYAGINQTWGLDEILLGEDDYWVMGDNRSMDQKSHTMQPVKLQDIIGKVVF